MPYSSDVFDDLVQKIFDYIAPKKFLDIGSGAGKYITMMRRVIPESYIVAIEIESKYISQFDLTSIANEVRCMEAVEQIKNVDENYDLAVFGDSIEHMRKSDGMDLLHFLVYRTNFILVVYPNRYIQNSVDGVVSEAHLSVWSEQDFSCLKHTNIIEMDGQRLIVVEGYLSKDEDIVHIENIVNSHFREMKT